VQTTVASSREKLDEIIVLSNTWVQLACDKERFENTDRNNEIRIQIQANYNRFERLALDIKTGGELLVELNMEFSN
jgi:hypothetical protein